MEEHNELTCNSHEYKKLLNKLKAVEIERNEIESVNKKLIHDLKVYYEERIRILELNYSSKAFWTNFESEMTKNYEDKCVGCNLLSDMNLNDLIHVTDSKTFLKNLNRIIKNELKKIKSEILEINSKRSDLINMFENYNSYLTNESTNQKTKGILNRFKNFEKNSPKIKNDHLDALYEKFDSQIVELSNVFLNEKLDLIFKHNQLMDELNQKLIEVKSPSESYIKNSHTQTANIDLENLARQLKKLGHEENFVSQAIQTDIINIKFENIKKILDNSSKLAIDHLDYENMFNLICTNNNNSCDKCEKIEAIINLKLNDLERQNENLNQINDELKLIICRMYEKLNNF